MPDPRRSGRCRSGHVVELRLVRGGSPKAALDYFTANAHDLVLGPGGDLGVGVAGTSYALVLAKCG